MSRTKIEIAIQVEAGGWPREEELLGLAEAAVGAALDALGRQGGPAELSLLFTDDARMKSLNARWRGKDRPTNVLSFPAFAVSPGDPLPPLLGDIALSFETVEREAEDERKPFQHHLSHLVVHGLLHLLGYDHEGEEEAGEMESLERRALAALAIPDPYA